MRIVIKEKEYFQARASWKIEELSKEGALVAVARLPGL